MEKAHDLTQEKRTEDVCADGDISFRDMLLSDATLKGLDAAGFRKPSPIQRKAIPLGRCGFDLIVQAKSGTGKTCVFTVIALEMLNRNLEKLQVVILAPTREISVQLANVMSSICRGTSKPKIETFIGGLPLKDDTRKITKCQVAVGAPGRMKHLISNGLMNVDAVRLFVLDEADRLMEEGFRKDISYIYSKLPLNKQIIAASATFPEELEKFVSRYMKNPMKVSPGGDTILIGVRQFVSVIPRHPAVLVQMENKTAELIKILSSISFKQCLVFSNYQSRAESICDKLNKQGWPAIYINGSQSQTERLKAFNKLKEYRCRILLSTDLTSRGIDAENVNLIVNLDLPYDGATYLHRIGRAGRYGTYGIAVTIVQNNEEVKEFQKLLYGVGGEDFQICVFPNERFSFNIWDADEDKFEKLKSLVGVYKYVKNSEKPSCSAKSHTESGPSERAEAVAAILKNCVRTTIKLPLYSFKSLSNELKSFKIGDEVYHEKNEIDLDLKVSQELESSVTDLENIGWKSFYDNFKLTKSDVKLYTAVCDAEYTNNEKYCPGEWQELNEEDYGYNVEDCGDDDEDDEVEEEEEEEEEEEDVDDDDDYLWKAEYKGDRPANFYGEKINSKTLRANEIESEKYNVDKRILNDTLKWYSLWYQQLAHLRHYVQYYNLWKNVNKFR